MQNEMARDSYSYLHFVMVAGIVLVALGMKKTLGDVDEPLKTVPAFALLGGTALYLLGHVAFRYRQRQDDQPPAADPRAWRCWPRCRSRRRWRRCSRWGS